MDNYINVRMTKSDSNNLKATRPTCDPDTFTIFDDTVFDDLERQLEFEVLKNNEGGEPGSGPWRVVLNDATVEDNHIIGKQGKKKEAVKIIVDGEECTAEFALIEPRMWSIKENKGLAAQKIRNTQRYLVADVLTRSGQEYTGVLYLHPLLEKLRNLIPDRTVFVSDVYSMNEDKLEGPNKYTINILKQNIKAKDFSLYFGTYTRNIEPFNAFSKGSSCMILNFEIDSKVCEIGIIQTTPTYFITNFIDRFGNVVIDRSEIIGQKDYKITKKCVTLVNKSNKDQGCKTNTENYTLEQIQTIERDWSIRSWCEVARQFTVYFNYFSKIRLQDEATSVLSIRKTDDVAFSKICLSHLSLGRNGQCFYDKYFYDLKPINFDNDLYKVFLLFLRNKEYSNIDPEIRSIINNMGLKIPFDTNLHGPNGIVQKVLGTLTASANANTLELFNAIKKVDVFENLPSTFQDFDDSNYMRITYFLWNKIIKGLSYKSEQNRLRVLLEAKYTTLDKRAISAKIRKINNFDPYKIIWETTDIKRRVKNSYIHWQDWAPCYI